MRTYVCIGAALSTVEQYLGGLRRPASSVTRSLLQHVRYVQSSAACDGGTALSLPGARDVCWSSAPSPGQRWWCFACVLQTVRAAGDTGTSVDSPHQPPSAQQEDATSRPSESKRQVKERGKILEEIESYHGRTCERVPRPARHRRVPVFPRLRWFLFARLGAKRVVFFCGGNMREQASNRPALGVPDVIPSMQRVHHHRKTAAAAAAAAAAATAQGAGWLVRWIAGRDQAGQQAPAVWSAHLT